MRMIDSTTRCVLRAGVVLCLVGAAATAQVNHFEDAGEPVRHEMESKSMEKFDPSMLPYKNALEAPVPAEYADAVAMSDKIRTSRGFGPVPPNDDCVNAIDVGALPALIDGTTIGATWDSSAPTCVTTVEDDSAGVWYRVIGTGNLMVASTCEGAFPGATADYDSKINVYCNDCGVLTCVAGNDDDAANGCGFDGGAGSRRSTVSFCSEAGAEYLILVHGFCCIAPLDGVGNFTLGVGDSGQPCQGAVNCGGDGGGGCDVMCQGTSEGEPTCFDEYDDTTNGGCNSIPEVFGSITCGETICGTSGTFSAGGLDSRDTDWFALTLASEQEVTWSVDAEFPVLVGIVDNGGVPSCAGVSAFLVSNTGDPCVTTSVTATLPAGTWWMFVAPSDFVGVPCGAEWSGTVTCDAPPTGACCFGDGSCQDGMTAGDCGAAGGTYQGDGTNCANVICPIAPENDLCANAIAIDVPSMTDGTTELATIDSEFPFCGTGITSPGVWYSVIGTGNTITASFCTGFASYDSKLSVYCGGCETPTCITGNDDTCGLSSEVSWCSQAGAEYLILVHGFGGAAGPFLLDVFDDGVGCTAGVQCLPEGACCFDDGTCFVTTQFDCEGQGGSYAGDDVPCGGPGGYVASDCGNAFNDISGTGNALVLGDDAGQVVGLGFSFDFFGNTYTDIAVCSNGYLTFGGDLTDFSNDDIPDSFDPNDIIAPLWDDLNPTAGGTVHHETQGAAPDRVFIAQWTDVPQFGSSDANTFQALLFEGSNTIEFRYGSFTPEAFAGDYTIGIENSDGSDGVAVDAAGVAPGDCIHFGTVVNPDPCNQAPDCGDPAVVELWPPNHAYHAIDVAALSGASDPDGDDLTFVVTSITQDEPTNANGDGNTPCDGEGVGTGVAMVRAERQGGGNGRVYHVSYTADDGNGGTCDGTIIVEVPHNQSPHGAAVDDGQAYDSTDCGNAADVNADTKVDVDDVVRVLVEFGRVASGNYWPDGDANQDGIVNSADVVYVFNAIRSPAAPADDPTRF